MKKLNLEEIKKTAEKRNNKTRQSVNQIIFRKNIDKIVNKWSKKKCHMIFKINQNKPKLRNPLLMNIVIKKNNLTTAFDTIVKKNILQNYINKGFEIISVQY